MGSNITFFEKRQRGLFISIDITVMRYLIIDIRIACPYCHIWSLCIDVVPAMKSFRRACFRTRSSGLTTNPVTIRMVFHTAEIFRLKPTLEDDSCKTVMYCRYYISLRSATNQKVTAMRYWTQLSTRFYESYSVLNERKLCYCQAKSFICTDNIYRCIFILLVI